MHKTFDFSLQHKEFLKKEKQRKISVHLTRILLLVFFFSLWEILARLNAIDAFLTSSPSGIVAAIRDLLKTDSFSKHVFTTLYETVTGFLIATFAGGAIALALWWSPFLRKVLEPYLIVLNGLPKIALGPIIIIWFGSGTKAIVFMAVIITVIVTIIGMLNGFLACDEGKIMLLRSMGANRFQILTKLVLPSSLPTFISCLKINVGMSWIGSIMGEYLSSKQGIGYLIVYGGQVFKLDLVMASTVVLCILAGGMYAIVSLLEKILVKK